MASNHIESNTLQFSEDMEKPHILVIATGGTIASKESELGLTPAMKNLYPIFREFVTCVHWTLSSL